MLIFGRMTTLIVLSLIAIACGGRAEPSNPPVPTGDEAIAKEIPEFEVVARAIDTAAAYVNARSQWDDGAAVELLHPEAIVVDTPLATREDQQALFRFFEAVEWHWTLSRCEESRLDGSFERRPQRRSLAQPIELVCRYDSDNAWSRALAAGPISGQFRFAISDGLITELYHDYDVVTWNNEVISNFRAWVETNHPDAPAAIWKLEGIIRPDDADQGLPRRVVPVLSADAAELFAELTDAFAAAA